MTRVIAAIDTSAAASPVLDTAVALAGLLGATVEALYVRHEGGPEPAALAEAAGLPLRVEEGDPVDTIIAALDGSDVVLGVVGCRGHPAGVRPAGHTALAVVQRTSKPIAMVPPDCLPRRDGLRRMLVPLDGTTDTAAAVDTTIVSLSRAGLEVVALHVFDPNTVPLFWDQPQHETNSWGREFLARYCAHPGARVELRAGPPELRVPEVVEEQHIDLVVLAWGQDLSAGHARTVREVLARVCVPVLLLPVPSHVEWPSVSAATA